MTSDDRPDLQAENWLIEVCVDGQWQVWENGSLDEVLTELYAFRERFSRIRLVAPSGPEQVIGNAVASAV